MFLVYSYRLLLNHNLLVERGKDNILPAEVYTPTLANFFTISTSIWSVDWYVMKVRLSPWIITERALKSSSSLRRHARIR